MDAYFSVVTTSIATKGSIAKTGAVVQHRRIIATFICHQIPLFLT